jgi:uncharacterized protein
VNGAVFIDTSAWYAGVDRGDTSHALASRRFQRLVAEESTLVTTNHVISETYTLLRVRFHPTVVHGFLQRLRSSRLTRRVFVLESWEEAAEDLLVQYADQPFSYVDATSFVTMRRLGLDEALTFDHHFSVAGFALLGDA